MASSLHRRALNRCMAMASEEGRKVIEEDRRKGTEEERVQEEENTQARVVVGKVNPGVVQLHEKEIRAAMRMKNREEGRLRARALKELSLECVELSRELSLAREREVLDRNIPVVREVSSPPRVRSDVLFMGRSLPSRPEGNRRGTIFQLR